MYLFQLSFRSTSLITMYHHLGMPKTTTQFRLNPSLGFSVLIARHQLAVYPTRTIEPDGTSPLNCARPATPPRSLRWSLSSGNVLSTQSNTGTFADRN